MLNTEDVYLVDERGPANAKNTAVISLSSRSNNEEEPCKSKAMVVSGPSDNARNVEFWKIIEKVRKQRSGHSNNVPCFKGSILHI